MDPADILSSFSRHGLGSEWSLIEGNRGLYDGADSGGTHSTAELAKLLRAPVILVMNATKVTRTVAACVLGCQNLDPACRIAGVVLNQVSGQRHEQVAREAVEHSCGIPVLGALPRARPNMLLPQRHLGLVTPQEHPRVDELKRNILELVRDRIDFDRLVEISRGAEPLRSAGAAEHDKPSGQDLCIGFLRDSAFNFYYPENLEALEAAGASLVPISGLEDQPLPANLDALYIGGGFPETHGTVLSSNTRFLRSLHQSALRGLPIYAECGGLMLLSKSIRWKGDTYPMAEVLPFDVEVGPKPEGHGYAELHVDRENPFFPEGTALRGHEFHYSRIIPGSDLPPTVGAVRRGTGCCQGRDGVVVGNVWASYTHLHALGSPEWTAGLLAAANRYKTGRISNPDEN
jgi:cobyrinic acid a,c-diamide synthase